MDLHVAPRAARDSDADGLIALIGEVFREYPGCVLDVDGEAPELRAIASAYGGRGGGFWVCEKDARIVASVGWLPAEDEAVELRKLYVARPERRRGLASALIDLVEAEACRRKARLVELWSDTRFEDAHRLYERRGYRRDGRTRELHDLSDSVELYFRREL